MNPHLLHATADAIRERNPICDNGARGNIRRPNRISTLARLSIEVQAASTDRKVLGIWLEKLRNTR